MFCCWLLVVSFYYFGIRRINRRVWDRLFCIRITLPNSKGVALGILADGKVAHLRHSRFRHADFTTELLDLFGELDDRINADVVDNWLSRLPAPLERTIGRIVGAARIDVPVIASARKGIDLPAKQIAIKRLGTVGVVGRDFKPNDARLLFLF